MDFDEILIEELIVNSRLSPEQVERINEATRGKSLTFAQAALELYLVTPKELANATASAREIIDQVNPGLIETAVRRVSTGRNALTVRTVTATRSPRS